MAVAARDQRRVGHRALGGRGVNVEDIVGACGGIAGRIAGRSDGVDHLAFGQAHQCVVPVAVGGDRRLAVDAVDVDGHRIAGIGGSAQRGRAAVEIGGGEIKAAVASRGHRRVGYRAFTDRRVNGEVVGRALRRVADTVGGCGDRLNDFAVGEPGQRVGPTAVGGDGRLADDAHVAVNTDSHRVAGLGGPGQRGRAAVEIGCVEIELAVATRGHRRVGDRALADRRFDNEVVILDHEIARGVGGRGDRKDALAVGQPRNRVGPGAVGADRRGPRDAVDVDGHRVAGVSGPGQRSRSTVEIGGVEIEAAVASRGHRRVGYRAFTDRRVNGEVVGRLCAMSPKASVAVATASTTSPLVSPVSA